MQHGKPSTDKNEPKNKAKNSLKSARKSGANIDISRIIATNSHFIKLSKGGGNGTKKN